MDSHSNEHHHHHDFAHELHARGDPGLRYQNYSKNRNARMETYNNI